MSEYFAPANFDLGYDDYTGQRTRLHFDADGSVHVENSTPVAALAALNKAQANDVSRTGKSGDLVHAARIDMQTYLDLEQRGILRDKAAMRKWLQSDEALPFRTHHYTS